MREIRPSGLEGGGADTRSPYPYQGFAPRIQIDSNRLLRNDGWLLIWLAFDHPRRGRFWVRVLKTRILV